MSEEKRCTSEEKGCMSEEKGCMSEEKRCTSEEKGCMSEDKTEAAALFLRGLSLMKARECDLKRNIRQFFTHDKNSAVAVPRSKAASSLPDATSEVRKQKAKVPNRRPAVLTTPRKHKMQMQFRHFRHSTNIVAC